MKLAWNAIVKNEAAVIERCVSSLLPHIDGAIVVDTGSSDDTIRILEDMFRAAGKPLEVHGAHFENFEQARNEALKAARELSLEWDYLLLADADMELRVKQTPWLNGEKGLSYDIRQRGGSLVYYNRRLLSRAATGWYVGVTHEYLDVEPAGHIDTAEFIDHADGANRPSKFARDIALLEAALATETRQGLIQRYHFYLAGSYYDAGELAKAADHYQIRVVLGGFDQEVWYAQFRYAQCLKQLGDNGGYLREMFRAYQLRPSRGETLHDLAQHFRVLGDNDTSLLFSTPGVHLPKPDDQLFVDEWVHRVGLKEEFAICAWYDEAKRSKGAAVCDELALKGSHQARFNLFWYLKPLVEHVPSFRATRIELPLPAGYRATNPSVTNHNGQALAIVRTVNYTITPEGAYSVLGADGSFSRSHPIRTCNYLVWFSRTLAVELIHQLAPPKDWPEPKFDLVIGFEDSRLFTWSGNLWTLSTVRELTPEGWCEQVLAPVGSAGYGPGWNQVYPPERRHEKNWMPWVTPQGLRFVYRLGHIINRMGHTTHKHECDLDVGHISGSSQVVRAENYNIALVHEARFLPGQQKRYYQHRFVLLGDAGELVGISRAFVFNDKQIEFAAGLAYFPDTHKLVASYGVRDSEAWLAEMDVFEVLEFIGGSAMITAVTAYVPIPNHPRPEKDYRALASQLLTLDIPIMSLEAKIEDCWLHEYLQHRQRRFTHSVADNPKKNSVAYHIVQAQKSEWLVEAAYANPAADVLVWIDYGIFSIPGITGPIIRDFLIRARDEKLIAIPGCWDSDYTYDDKWPCWRFCGGVFVVPRDQVIDFDTAMKSEYMEWLDRTNNLSWEVNTLARVEKNFKLPIWHYKADHNASLFTAYRASDQQTVH